jgi:hypothetical protein
MDHIVDSSTADPEFLSKANLRMTGTPYAIDQLNNVHMHFGIKRLCKF